MNILIPDTWLREYLKTKATPTQIKEYLSLCGPSVERVTKKSNDWIYDIEITSNRPDSMSVVGIAREAAAILPRFDIKAQFIGNPYTFKGLTFKGETGHAKKLTITADPLLCPRFTSVVIDNVSVKPSPEWLRNRLEAAGIRPLNNIIDVTNYLMRSFGQPAHAFDYDQIKSSVMKLRSSKKGEKITTLDGKTHTLQGGDIVMEDGSGRLIDLCGIMGGENSSIKHTTKTVVLFIQVYDPVRIRKTSMSLSHRTEAATLFEKGLDPQLVLPTLSTGITLVRKLAGGVVASKIYDLYPKPYKPYTVTLSRDKLYTYIGDKLTDKEITSILSSLGFSVKTNRSIISVTVPSFRSDVTIDVDIIEEVARIKGYHSMPSALPSNPPPLTLAADPALHWEEEVKIRMRDWGYTELLTYSMISKNQMDSLKLDTAKSYAIANPLSSDWVYMRPVLWPSVLTAVATNLHYTDTLSVFELSSTYRHKPGKLPDEYPILMVVRTGEAFFELKGLAERLFEIFGIAFPAPDPSQPIDWYDPSMRLALGKYGSVGVLRSDLQERFNLSKPVTIVDLQFPLLVADATSVSSYKPIPKYPAVVEDLAFTVPRDFAVGPLIDALKTAHPLVADVSLLDVHADTRTLHVTYQDHSGNLTNEIITPVRQTLISKAQKEFGVIYKR